MSKFKTTAPTILAYDVNLAMALKKSKFKNFERVATFIHQLQFYVSLKSKADIFKVMNGQRYTYMNYREWAVVFPHWDERTLRRIVTEAQDTGIVISILKGRGRQSRSKWYSINEKILNNYMDGVAEVESGQLVQSQNSVESGQVDQFEGGQVDQFAQAITIVANTEVKKEDEDSKNNSNFIAGSATNCGNDIAGVKGELQPELDTPPKSSNRTNAELINQIIALAKNRWEDEDPERITPVTRENIAKRLKEGFTLEDFAKAIDMSTFWSASVPKTLAVLVRNKQSFNGFVTFQDRVDEKARQTGVVFGNKYMRVSVQE